MNWEGDPHLQWLKAGVPGFCHPGNIKAMATAIEQMPVGAVVEIGSFVGLSTCIISRLLELAERSAPFYSVDDWFFEGYVPGGKISPHITFDNWRNFTEQQFRANTAYFSACRPNHVKARSDEFFRMWAENLEFVDLFGRTAKLGGAISFAFIDGEHTYEGSKRDTTNVLRFLAPGGFVLLDDTYEGTPHQSRRTGVDLLDHPDLSLVGRFPNLMFQRKVTHA